MTKLEIASILFAMAILLAGYLLIKFENNNKRIVMSNIKAIIQKEELDFLMKNAAMVQDGDTKRYALPVMWNHEGKEALLIEMHPTPLQNANEYLKITLKEKGGVSDGYHTFDELYAHRIRLFIELLRRINTDAVIWCSKKHSDGSEWDGWFILGMHTEPGKQITYHLPISFWEEVAMDSDGPYKTEFAEVFEKAPEWDGHTSADVLARLAAL